MNWSCKPRKRELGRLDREGRKKGGGGKEERVRYTHTHTHTHTQGIRRRRGNKLDVR